MANLPASKGGVKEVFDGPFLCPDARVSHQGGKPGVSKLNKLLKKSARRRFFVVAFR